MQRALARVAFSDIGIYKRVRFTNPPEKTLITSLYLRRECNDNRRKRFCAYFILHQFLSPFQPQLLSCCLHFQATRGFLPALIVLRTQATCLRQRACHDSRACGVSLFFHFFNTALVTLRHENHNFHRSYGSGIVLSAVNA